MRESNITNLGGQSRPQKGLIPPQPAVSLHLKHMRIGVGASKTERAGSATAVRWWSSNGTRGRNSNLAGSATQNSLGMKREDKKEGVRGSNGVAGILPTSCSAPSAAR